MSSRNIATFGFNVFNFKDGVGKVFLRNLDDDIATETIYDLFSMFGNIVCCKIAQDGTGKSQGYGFVQYETEEMAIKCMVMANGMYLNNKKVEVGRKGLGPPSNTGSGHIPVTMSLLAITTPNQRKEMFGEHLFQEVQQIYPKIARKITNMLVALHYSKLLILLKDLDSLKAAAKLAASVLKTLEGQPGMKDEHIANLFIQNYC